MTTERPSIDPKGFYNQKQAAELLGVSRQTLWRYVRKGLIRKRTARGTGRTMFTGESILRCWNGGIPLM